MEKEIKVCLYRGEDDNFNELWKVIGEEKYFARNMCYDVSWYYVCDPLGYCELDHLVSEDIVFIMCDSNGKEFFRHSNGQPNPLPKFEDYVKQQWNKVKNNIPHNTENMTKEFWSMCWNGETTIGLNQWLISFKDPNLYGDAAKDYDENWYGCWHNTETDYTIIPNSQFEYLGSKYQFVKVHHKHDICEAEWDTFECVADPYEMSIWGTETHPFIDSYMEMGNWFDNSKYGTMLDKRTARERVVEKLHEIYPKEKKYGNLLYVKKNPPEKWCIAEAYCWKKGYGECADMLIDGDYHIDSISELISNMKAKTENVVFICNRENKEKIKEMYPEVYGYDMCLI